ECLAGLFRPFARFFAFLHCLSRIARQDQSRDDIAPGAEVVVAFTRLHRLAPCRQRLIVVMQIIVGVPDIVFGADLEFLGYQWTIRVDDALVQADSMMKWI